MIETKLLVRPNHEHTHAHEHEHHHGHDLDPQDDGVLALHAEDLYLRLADQARTSLMTNVVTSAAEESETLRNTKQRLGERVPRLDEQQQRLVNRAFTANYDTLPRREEEHHHGHDHGGCGKRHGPLQRLLEKAEHTTISRLKHRRAKVAVGMLFRAGLFTMCPGDDIAAIGLQVYDSVAGGQQEHHAEHEHAEVYAVLPRRPRLTVDLDAGKARVDLPLDNAVSHKQLPRNAVGNAVRNIIDDAPQVEPSPKPRNPEVRRRRSRVAAIGLLAVAAFGGLVSADSIEKPSTRESVQHAQPHTPIEKPLPTASTPPQSRSYASVETHRVAAGESQWNIARQRLIEVDLPVTNSKIQRVAQYIAKINKSTVKNPDYIQPGQSLDVPRKPLLLRLVA